MPPASVLDEPTRKRRAANGSRVDRAGLGPGASSILAHDGPILGHQVRVRLAVRLVLLLGLAGLAFRLARWPAVRSPRRSALAARCSARSASCWRGTIAACLSPLRTAARRPRADAPANSTQQP